MGSLCLCISKHTWFCFSTCLGSMVHNQLGLIPTLLHCEMGTFVSAVSLLECDVWVVWLLGCSQWHIFPFTPSPCLQKLLNDRCTDSVCCHGPRPALVSELCCMNICCNFLTVLRKEKRGNIFDGFHWAMCPSKHMMAFWIKTLVPSFNWCRKKLCSTWQTPTNWSRFI